MPDSGLSPHGERKVAVLLFADLTGYTDLCRRLDPEDVAATVRPLMAGLRTAAEQEGAEIPTMAGDGFMAVFGVPVAHEDIAERAVSAAMAMQRLISQRRDSAGVVEVPDVHIGLAAGEVLVVPSDEPTGWSLIGEPVNLAARLSDAAGPGEILLDDRLRSLVYTGLAAARRDLTLPGLDETSVAWALTAPPEAPVRAARTVPFVNRKAALAELDRLLEDVIAPRVGKVITVSGDAGIGKTRTVSHWVRSREEDVSSVWFSCATRTADNQLLRLIEQVSAQVGQPAPGVVSMLQPVARAVGQTPRYRSDLFPLVLNETRSLLERAAAQRPLVLVVDDAHNADPALRDVLVELRARPLHGPCLVVVVARSDGEDEPWPAELVLPPLDSNDLDTMLTAAIGAEPPPAVRDAVIGRAEGHPMMAVQSAEFLLESGLIEVVDGRCRVNAPEQLHALPTSLRVFVAARIDRLPSHDKALLQRVSTCGDAFDRTLAEALLGADAVRQLSPLVRRRMLTETPDGWRFTHALLREVAYVSLPRAQRARMHEQQLRIAPDDDPGQRAYHALAWADSVPATDVDVGARAASSAIRESRHYAESLFATRVRAALAAARRAQPLLDSHADASPDEAVRLLTLIANCLIELGRADEALSSAHAAGELAARAQVASSVRLGALLAQGDALSQLRRYQSSRQVLDDAVSLAEQVGDQTQHGHALRLLGDSYRHSDATMLLTLTERAYEVLTAAGDQHGAALCAQTMAYWLSTSPADRLERWLTRAKQSLTADDVRGKLLVARAEALASAMRMDYPTASAAAEICRSLGQQLGSVQAETEGLLIGIEAATGEGDLPAALSFAEAVITAATAQGNRRTRLIAAAVVALPLLRAGRAQQCAEELQVVRDGSGEFGPPEQLDCSVAAAAVSRDRGSWEEALTHLETAAEAVAHTHFGVQALAARTQEVRVATAAGRSVSDAVVDSLLAQLSVAGAPRLYRYAQAVAEQRRLLAGELAMPGAAQADAGAEEAAIGAENRALFAEREGRDPAGAWRDAATAWERLGYTIWLARAQARAGDRDAADRTLTMIDADADARAWALRDQA